MLTFFRKKRNGRGVYFVSTLMIAVLIGMIVTSALFLVRDSLRASSYLTSGDAALKAAQSGLRYAQSKLSANPNWRGDDNRVTVDEPDLIVEERDGNVIGLVKVEQKAFAQFRLRFNWQDDATDDLDGFKDPPKSAWIDSQYVSLNNLKSGGEADVPRAEGDNYEVNTDSPRPYTVPTGTACVIVEGRVGSGLANLSADNLNPLPSGQVTSRVVEAYFRVASQPGADAAAMAAGNITVNLVDKTDKKDVFSVTTSTGIPRVRSKKKVKVIGGYEDENYVSPLGEVLSGDGTLDAGRVSQSNVTTDIEDPNENFYKLEWDDVKKAKPTDTKVPAGTYVVWDDGSVHFYDMNYSDYVSFIEANPTDAGTTPTFDPKTVEVSSGKIKIKGNVFVESSVNSDEFNFIPRGGAEEDPGGGGLIPQSELPTAVDTVVNSAPAPWATDVVGSQFTFTGVDTSLLSSPVVITTGSNFSVRLSAQGPNDGLLQITDRYNAYRESGMGTDVSLKAVFSAVLTDPAILAMDPAAVTKLGLMMGSLSNSSGGMGKLDLGAVTPKKTADDLEVTFEPEKGQTAILSADGDINIGSKVKGQGASITSGKNLKIVGAGSDLSANIADGLNLYAKGDITLSSLNPKGSDAYEYKDFKMKGVIYAWGDFRAKLGKDDSRVSKWGKFNLQGALVAYGSKNQTALGKPGTGDGGAIDIGAQSANLVFDPAYLAAFTYKVEPGPLKQTLYTTY